MALLALRARLGDFFLGALALGQPLTLILVLCLISAPFWPVIVVGITRL
jgi:hypothetical protein